MSERFHRALEQIDAANRQDPNTETVDGKPVPREWIYSRWLAEWVERLQPDASEELRLAARCQHIERWKIPRESFPTGRRGYLGWRDALKEYHSRRSAEILAQVGYPEAAIRRVQSLNRKEDLGRDPEMQALEDALCLVFLERQFGDLARKTERRRMVRVLRKTWEKMSRQAHQLALQLDYGAEEKSLIEEALLQPE